MNLMRGLWLTLGGLAVGVVAMFLLINVASQEYALPPAAKRGALASRGLAAGIVVGALVGLLGRAGTIVLPGWERFFSDGRITVYALWTFLGAAAGTLVRGEGSNLLAATMQEGQDHDAGSRPAR